MRFNEHHDVIMAGGYPKIHDKIKSIIRPMDIKGKVVFDVGACTGSLGLWAAAQGAKAVLINDSNQEYLDRAKLYAMQHAIKNNFDIDKMIFNLAKVDGFWKCPIDIQTVIARRFVYLLRDEGIRTNFVYQLKQNGCKVVYLQGLVRVKNHVEPLWNVDLEAQSFIDAGYKVTYNNGNDLIRLELR
jgi:hypothetical protein